MPLQREMPAGSEAVLRWLAFAASVSAIGILVAGNRVAGGWLILASLALAAWPAWRSLTRALRSTAGQ